jgi:drug/metabolite transporter superfamily protein YnfA
LPREADGTTERQKALQWWSWILTFVGVFGLWLAGRKSRWGWAVGLGAQGLWIAYALITTQYGFLFSAAAYGWIYVKNFLAWNPAPTGHRKTPSIPGSRDFLRAWGKTAGK